MAADMAETRSSSTPWGSAEAMVRPSTLTMAKIFTTTSDQLSTVEEKDDHFLYTIHRCPVCWGRHTDKPACFIATGLLQESLKWVSGGYEFRVVQVAAKSCGDDTCNFICYKDPVT